MPPRTLPHPPPLERVWSRTTSPVGPLVHLVVIVAVVVVAAAVVGGGEEKRRGVGGGKGIVEEVKELE